MRSKNEQERLFGPDSVYGSPGQHLAASRPLTTLVIGMRKAPVQYLAFLSPCRDVTCEKIGNGARAH